MNNILTRFISSLLAILMILSVVSFGVFAEEETTKADDKEEVKIATEQESESKDNKDSTDASKTSDNTANSDSSEGSEDDEEEEDVIVNKSNFYCNTIYQAQEEKLHYMTLKQRAFGYELYCDEYTGEIACKNLTTGEVIFTNPYDVASSPSSNDVKYDLLSQIILQYSDTTGSTFEFNSFEDAAVKEQIKVKNLRNGVRVEYSLGDEEVRYLVPMLIKKERYDELIYSLVSQDPKAKRKFDAYYQLQDPNDVTLSVRAVKEMQAKFPITEKMAVYVFDSAASARELRLIENYIKMMCPDYTYATLEEDHQITGYTATQKAPPLFKMALEYYLDEEGLQIRLPANGIRYNEDDYQLLSIKILPFFGAGANPNTGYTFIPDGSGALFAFEDLAGTAVTVTGKVYGLDYAYHEIGTVKQETMRLPVYGVVENYSGQSASLYQYYVEDYMDEDSGEFTPAHWAVGSDYTEIKEDRGYFAILEEGDALASITTLHGGSQHKYNSVYTEFYPRPTDSYNLSNSISVADNTVWTITSNRKYTGSYKIRIIQLTDENKAKEAGLSEGEYYECSYVGMAKAYRDYLEKNGSLTKKEKTNDDIPLYIESFGAIDTSSTFLSIPVTVKTPLTTFDNIKTMYDELSSEGIKNINFRLTGFANGGMEYVVPAGVDFEDVVGGEEGFVDLVKYANEKGFGIFPDFDFSYAQKNTLTDGFNQKRDAVRTIDNRYTLRREYSSSYQVTMPSSLIAISASVFGNFYDKVQSDLSKYELSGISVSTLGSELNSDFDKKDPYNREDAKELVCGLLDQISQDYSDTMIDAGNAYTWKYADHILNVTLDSSHFNYAANTVPFIGMVLHGYVNFAGKPTNMSSDMGYETLKMLESGAMPYFTLSYQNTPLLKESETLSKYYSVAYDIWKEDLVKTYKSLNELLKEVQDATIENHEFLVGQRVPSEEELEADAEIKAEQEAKAKEASDALAEKLERARKLAARKGGAVITEEETEETEEVLEIEETTAKTEDKAAKDETKAEETTDEAESEAESSETAESEAETTTENAAPATENTKVDKYTVNDGSIVRVTYSNGICYILNYNRFSVVVEGQTIEPLSYVKVSN